MPLFRACSSRSLPCIPAVACRCSRSFQKRMTVQALTYEELQALGPSVAKMAEVVY